MAFIHSCWTQSNNQSGIVMMNTGATRMGHPCVGSWAHRLGSKRQSAELRR
jgi:hypothetical protein